jgi:hypothetical protein
MANVRCANCGAGSGSTQAGFDRINCLECGRETDLRGNLLPRLVSFTTPEGFRGGSQQGVRKAE